MEKKQLQELAEISMLRFTDTEYEALSRKFDEAFKKVRVLLTANVDGLPLHPQPTGMDTLADDKVIPGFTIEQALENAPRKRDRYFVVPQVFE